MRILFSVYQEDPWGETNELLYSKLVETDTKIEDIDSSLGLHAGFRSVMEIGKNLSFWDVYCYLINPDDVIKIIESIPIYQESIGVIKEPDVLIVEDFDPRSTQDPSFPDFQKCYFYRQDRFECGAGDYRAVVAFASEHPWLMVFIGGMLWDITKLFGKCLCKKLKTWFGLVDTSGHQKRVYCLSTKNVYRNFKALTNIHKNDCQIVYLDRKKNNLFDVRIRTIDNLIYSCKCNSRGKIYMLKQTRSNGHERRDPRER